MRKYAVMGAILLAVLSWVPLALIARARTVKSPKPRIQLIQDMGSQPKYRAQQMDPLFADQRAMRPQVPGTIARGQLREDTFYFEGVVKGQWATTFPMDVTDNLMKRGQRRFDIYCAPCHGFSGDGNGMVAVLAGELQEGTWVPPTDLRADQVRERPVGHLFNTITNGIRTMPAYGKQIPVEDRWAIVSYVLALQKSQRATIQDAPENIRPSLK